MQFERFVPSEPFDRFVDHFWFVRSDAVRYPRQTLFPDGGLTILFNLGAPHALVDSGTGQATEYSTAWVSGERESPFLLEGYGPTAIAGIRFKPGGAFPFLSAPAVLLTDRVVNLDDLFGSESLSFLERVQAAVNPPGVFRVLQDFLTNRLRPEYVEGNRLVRRAVRLLEGLGPSSSIVQLAGRIGVSHRHLLREFDRWVGLRPKMLQRILRFQRLIALEDSDSQLHWSAAAQCCGYYDQPHLIRDFKAFTGITPERYRDLRLPYPNYVPEV